MKKYKTEADIRKALQRRIDEGISKRGLAKQLGIANTTLHDFMTRGGGLSDSFADKINLMKVFIEKK